MRWRYILYSDDADPYEYVESVLCSGPISTGGGTTLCCMLLIMLMVMRKLVNMSPGAADYVLERMNVRASKVLLVARRLKSIMWL